MTQPFEKDLKAAKAAARADAKARVRAISGAEFRAIGRAMARYLTADPLLRQAPALFCFVSLCSEPDTRPILEFALLHHKALYLPRMRPHGEMDAVPVENFSALRPNAYGILEPGESLTGTASPAALCGMGALAVLPCLAAGRDGTRLGRGGGYYDRFLAEFTGESVLLCPNALLYPTLPTGPLDVRPRRLLTESGFVPPA